MPTAAGSGPPPADLGGKSVLTGEQFEELKALRRENAELRRVGVTPKGARMFPGGV